MLSRSNRVAAAASATAFALCASALPVIAGHLRPASAAATAPTYPQLSEPRVFARGNATLYNPDAIVVTKRFAFVVYQGQSDHLPGPSTIVKYDRSGRAVGSVALDGRCDGLRLNPVTHLLWATFNNDGLNGDPQRQPLLYTIDPKTLAAKLYRFASVQPHGGGYDDIAFVGSHAYLSASAPTLTASGRNEKPVVVEAALTADGKVNIAPILNGTASGWDATNKKYAQFNISDPDSLAVDSQNDLVLVGDNDQQVIVIRQPSGGSTQTIVRYGLGTQLDDIAWTSGTGGTLWIADDALNVIYTVGTQFSPGTVFGESQSGIPVSSFIGTFGAGDARGVLTPLLTARDGIVSPTSLVFVSAGGPTDDI
ncbi:MAG: hypothetical protein M3R53_00650 [Candidatus Eremiobacteraeota bacterium]|nr:hypothetical protein [Candidatus Eremiobacteraeota bacterium]